MYLLDTDALTHVFAGHRAIVRRLASLEDPDVGTTVGRRSNSFVADMSSFSRRPQDPKCSAPKSGFRGRSASLRTCGSFPSMRRLSRNSTAFAACPGYANGARGPTDREHGARSPRDTRDAERPALSASPGPHRRELDRLSAADGRIHDNPLIALPRASPRTGKASITTSTTSPARGRKPIAWSSSGVAGTALDRPRDQVTESCPDAPAQQLTV